MSESKKILVGEDSSIIINLTKKCAGIRKLSNEGRQKWETSAGISGKRAI
jgi:hypothetical protein